MVSKLVWEEQLCSWVLILYPCSHYFWVYFELDGSEDIFLIWISVHLYLLPSESLLCFPFHSAIIASIMLPRHSRLYLPFVVVVIGFSPPDNKLHFVECCSIRHPWSAHTLSYTFMYTQHTHTVMYHVLSVTLFSCIATVFICFLYFFILCFVDSWMAPAGFMAWPVWMI